MKHKHSSHNGNGKWRKRLRAETARESTAEPSAIADPNLVRQCVGGDQRAWVELHRRCQPRLLASIRSALGRRAADSNLIEEIAARVWYSLVSGNFRLLERYRPDESSNGLASYVAGIARVEVLRYLRAEHIRRQREADAEAGRRRRAEDQESLLSLDMDSFLATLTPRERYFYDHFLAALPEDVEHNSLTQSNRWQLGHRVRRKLSEFLNG